MNVNTAQRIEQRRTALGINQRDAAAAAEISQATWSRIESGDKKPTLVQLLTIANALDTTLEALTEDSPFREGLQFAARTNNQVDATAEEVANAEAFLEQMKMILEVDAHLAYIGVGRHHE